MTEPDTQDEQLKTYLQGKSSLSAYYRQLNPRQPAAAIDRRIRHAAKTRHVRRWYVSSALAATLLLGLALFWWWPGRSPVSSSLPQSQAPVHPATLPEQIDRGFHNNPAADAWLNRILQLQQAGKTQQAAAEFKKFRAAYPVYSIDQQRFGSLKQYDTQ